MTEIEEWRGNLRQSERRMWEAIGYWALGWAVACILIPNDGSVVAFLTRAFIVGLPAGMVYCAWRMIRISRHVLRRLSRGQESDCMNDRTG